VGRGSRAALVQAWMNRKVILRPQAEAELAEAVDWYETRGKGLGADFIRAVDAAMAAIERNPEQYQIVKGQVRRAVLRRFPYGLIYVASQHEITVLACFHGRRDPRRWFERS
jgi:plasmid stabilization system protein ParE